MTTSLPCQEKDILQLCVLSLCIGAAEKPHEYCCSGNASSEVPPSLTLAVGESLKVLDSTRSIFADRKRLPTLEPMRLARPKLRRVLTDRLEPGASETVSDGVTAS